MTGGRAALDYAEREIGVHSVLERAEERAEALDMIRSDLSNWRRRRNTLEDAIADREIEVASELRAAMPDASQAAFEREFKGVARTDTKLRELRGELSEANFTISNLDVDAARTKTQVDIAVARMAELGGYFQYLAAIKQAETAEKFTEVLKGTDWPPG